MDQDSVLAFLKDKADRPLKAKDIARALEVPTPEYPGFKRLLREMETAGRIYRVRRGRYAAPDRINLVVGRLQVTRAGAGFVIPEDDVGEGDVFIRASRLGNAYSGDRVVARIEGGRRGPKREGTVVKVLERSRDQIVGVFEKTGRYGFVIPEDRTMHRDVFVAPDGAKVAKGGDLVVARIVDWGSDHHDPVGEIVEVLGRPGHPGVDVLGIAYGHQLPVEFPTAVLREADELAAAAPSELSHLEGRTDYRDQLTFTIDPSDAKDHDDAVSIESLEPNGWKVGVHIADVSHYVREGSALDSEAFARGTSVYLVDRVLPMLPEAISSDICSLRPNEDRLTLTMSIELDSDAAVKKVRLEESVIRSLHRLSYEEAQEIIDGKRKAPQRLTSCLRSLRDLALALQKRREKRGGLDFDLPEARVVLDAAGEPTHVQRLMKLESHRLIEEFMILANESVAQIASRREWPFIYRVHEAPDPAKLERLRDLAAGFGLGLARDAHRSPRPLQKLLRSVEGRPEETIVSTLALRSLKQARYQNENKGHFGLGSKAYTHFTSPIRRYPDLVVHRILRTALLQERAVPSSLSNRLAAVADQASSRERLAVDAERDSVELKKIEYMERHIGDTFPGTISGVASYGLFVLLDDVLVEGRVHVSSLEDDYYEFLEDEYALVGRSRGRRFRLGDRIQVSVLKVDRRARELDLAEAQRPPN